MLKEVCMTKTLSLGLGLSVLVSSILLGGCSTMAPGTQVKKLDERGRVEVELIPASYREVYFSPAKSDERHCRAPDPDFTVQQSDQLTAALPASSGASLTGGENQTGLSLGGRTETLLITRELMYRACELSANINADAETTIAVYASFLSSIQDITKSSSNNSNDTYTNPEWSQDEQDSEVEVESESDDFNDAN